MSVRSLLPLAAVGLALIGPGQLAAQGASSQVRPAQSTAATECDVLVQRVETRMSTALAVKTPGANQDLQQARELCASGQPEQGIPILRGILSGMNNN